MTTVDEYLGIYESKSTLKTYKAALKKYFALFDPDREPDKPTKKTLDELVELYFKQERNVKHDVQEFYILIRSSPSTSRLYLNVVKNFLLENGIELPLLFWKRLKKANGSTKALTNDRIPTQDELRNILNQTPLRARAFFMMLASSGMRGGEAIQLTMDDIKLEADPPIINIRRGYTKTRESRVAFISREALDILNEWLKVRDDYIETHTRADHLKTRIFPVTGTAMSRLFNEALEKTGLRARAC